VPDVVDAPVVSGAGEFAGTGVEVVGAVEPARSVSALDRLLSLQLIIDTATTPIRRALIARTHWRTGIAHLLHFDSTRR